MSSEPKPHPSRQQLAAFDSGQLSSAERTSIERHLIVCSVCGRELDMLPEDPFVALLRAATVPLAMAEEPAALPDALTHHPRYRILEALGSGGMGVVYKSIHRVMDRVVALKVLHRRFSDQPVFVERFRQEAQGIARLSHPHIALAHDAEQAGDLHFLVMEFVPGASLDRVVTQRGPLPVAEACTYVYQAALGLQHAFEQGLVHRDVKPANLMRTPAGQIKVLDFGLAQLARTSGKEAASALGGVILGTPDYMAPEQAREPQSADIRADIYALGCTLYFLLTGRPPFPGETALQKLLAHQDRPPHPISQFRDDVPADLEVLLGRMLAKEPAQRPATPGDVARALAPFAGMSAEPTAIDRALPPPRRRWLWLSAAATLLGIAGVVLILVWTRSSHSPSTEAAQATDKATPASVDPLALATPEQLVHLRNEQRDQALAWLEHNGRKGRQRGLVNSTAARFDEYPGRIDGFQILLGAGSLESLPAVLLAGNLGGFFVYPLTAEQARTLRIQPGTLRIRSYRNIADQRRQTPRVKLSALQFDEGALVDLHKKSAGSIRYEVRGPALTQAFAVRLSVMLDGGQRLSVLQWFTDRTLQGRGTLRFSCGPLGTRDFQPRGPFVVSADLCTDDQGSLIVESDSASRLLEARSSLPSPLP
jgi:serine/threonine protein kinase